MTKAKRWIFVSIALLSGAGCSTGVRDGEASHADQDQVETTMIDHKDQFKACYEHSPRHNSGNVTTRFTIDESGRVTHSGVEMTTLADKDVEDCVLKTIRGIRFPSPPSGAPAQVMYPFKFMPQ